MIVFPKSNRPLVLYLITNEISGTFLRGQLRFLIDDGFDVVVGTRVTDSSAASQFDPAVEVVDLPFVREPSLLADMRALWKTIVLVRARRPTVLNASTPKAGLLGTIAGLVCRVPVRVYVVRGLRFETAAGWRRRLWRSLEWTAMRSANHVVFNSQSLRSVAEHEKLIQSGVGEIVGSGSGNGIAIDRFENLPSRADARAELGIAADADVVGFVGRFTTDKGLADLVSLLANELSGTAGLRLLLVGEHEDGDQLDDEVRALMDSDERIIRVGWTPEPGIAYRAMDVLAFPSAREGLPNVPLEAQLCGTPVVGYAATGTVDAVIAGETGLLVPVGDRAGLATALESLLADSARRMKMGEAGSEWVRRAFDQTEIWTAIAANYRRWMSSAP